MPLDSSASAMSVTGKVPLTSLGITLPHEHLIHRISVYSHKPDNTCLDVDLVVEELSIFRQAGGRTICDVTPLSVGRDPRALREVSQKSGVHVVSGLGLYELETWPDWMRKLSRSELADFLVAESQGGETGIAAGLIGEIASHNEDHSDWRKYRLWDEEAEIFRAVADTQRRTGLAISTHASLGRHGVAQLRTLIKAGCDPQRVVIGHCDAQGHEDPEVDLEYYHLLLAEGACLEFDLFGWEELLPDAQRFRRVAILVQEGFAGRLLLSTDTCRLSQLHRFGGRGFDYLFTTVLPGLRDAGISQEHIDQMTITNPARLLAH